MKKSRYIKVLKICDDCVVSESLLCESDSAYGTFSLIRANANPDDEHFEYFMPIANMNGYFAYFCEETMEYPNKMAKKHFNIIHNGNIYIIKKSNRNSIKNYALKNIKEKDFSFIFND